MHYKRQITHAAGSWLAVQINLAVARPLLDLLCQCYWLGSPKTLAGTLRWSRVFGWQWGAPALSWPSGCSALTSLDTQKGDRTTGESFMKSSVNEQQIPTTASDCTSLSVKSGV